MSKQTETGLFDRAMGMFTLIERMPQQISQAETDGLLRLLPPEVKRNLEAVLEPNVREAGVPFLRMVAKWMRSAVEAKKNGKKIVLVPFNFPPDLILAFENAVPLTSEVLTTIAAIGLEGGGERYWEFMMELGLPDHVCSSNSIELGSILTGQDMAPDAIVNAAPGGCDANSKIHEFVSHYLDIPQFVLEKPVDDSPEGISQYKIYFRQLIQFLENLTGEKLSEDRLRKLLEGGNRCAELYWELWDIHKVRPSPVPNIFNVFLPPIRYCMWGTEPAITTLEKMVAVAEKRMETHAYPAPKEKVRVLWAYTSYYFDLKNLFTWMELQGYSHLADVLDLYMPAPADTTSMDTMIDSLVDSAWNYPMNKQMAASSMSRAWVNDMVHVAKDLKADCVIHCGHDACKQTWSVVSILRDELMKRAGIPMLILHGDSWMKTTTPIAVIQDEIDEFMKHVVIPKTAKKKKIRRRQIIRSTS